MKKKILCFCYLLASISQANPICHQGNKNNLTLHDFVTKKVESSQDSSLLAYYQRDTAAPIRTKAQTDQDIQTRKNKTACLPETNQSKIQDFVFELQNAVRLPQISPVCIHNSMGRENKTLTYFCQIKNGKMTKTSMGSPGPQGPCMTSEIASYVSWAMSKAIACLNDPQKPINPLLIYKKFNNETGFNFTAASIGGVGIGQLTTAAIKDINSESMYVRNVLNSTRPECEPFKSALQKLPQSATSYCELIEPSDGLARNLFYSISYFLRIRDHYMEKLRVNQLLQNNNPPIESADYQNYIALAAYGAEGLAVFPKILQAAKRFPNNYAQFEKSAGAQSVYLRATEAKFKEVTLTLKPEEKSCVVSAPERPVAAK